MKQQLLVFVTALMLLACGTSAFQAEIDQLNDLSSTLSSCADGVEAIDTTAFMKMYKDVQHERDFLNIYNRDTLPRDEAVFLGNYFRYMKKRMARILKGRSQMIVDLRTSAKQLEDLAGVIRAEEMEETIWRAHMSKEMTFVQRDTTLGFEMARDFKGISERYNKEHQQVVEYIKVHRENVKKAYEQTP